MLIETGRVSISLKIVEPVVEKPLTLSKRASTKRGILPLAYIGIAPIKLITIQESATIKNVWRVFIVILILRVGIFTARTKTKLTSIGIIKER